MLQRNELQLKNNNNPFGLKKKAVEEEEEEDSGKNDPIKFSGAVPVKPGPPPTKGLLNNAAHSVRQKAIKDANYGRRVATGFKEKKGNTNLVIADFTKDGPT